MNAGIQWLEEYETEAPECSGYSYKWASETQKMIDRGWKLFWRRRHMKPPQVSDTTPEQMIRMECETAEWRAQ